jgi:hypothetical protein
MRQRKLFLLFPFTQVLWKLVRKVWILSWQNILYIPECEIKCFSFCIMLSLISFCINTPHSNAMHKKPSARRWSQFVPIGMEMISWKRYPLNSTNMLSIRNFIILITSLSVYHFLHFVTCLRKKRYFVTHFWRKILCQ